MAVGDICIVSTDLIRAVDKARAINENVSINPSKKTQRRSSLTGNTGQSVGGTYTGNFAIVLKDGSFVVCNNASGGVDNNTLYLNGAAFVIPPTYVSAGKVYLVIDQSERIAQPVAVIVQDISAYKDKNGVYVIEIGEIKNNTAFQTFTGGSVFFTSPVIIHSSVSNFLALDNSQLSISQAVQNGTFVPVILNGVVEMRAAEALPETAYLE